MMQKEETLIQQLHVYSEAVKDNCMHCFTLNSIQDLGWEVFLNTLCGDANISHLVQNEEILVKNVPHVSLLCHSRSLKSIKFINIINKSNLCS